MKNNKKKGITFIEVLLSITIFAILSLSLYTMLNTSIMVRNKIEKEHNQLQNIYLTIDLIAQDLRNIIKFKKEDSGFKPEPDKIELYTLNFDYLNKTPKVIRLAYLLEDKTLYKIEKDILTENILNKYPLLEKVESFNLFYYKSPEEGWVSEWKEQIFPEAIKIEMVYKDKKSYNFKKYVFIPTAKNK